MINNKKRYKVLEMILSGIEELMTKRHKINCIESLSKGRLKFIDEPGYFKFENMDVDLISAHFDMNTSENEYRGSRAMDEAYLIFRGQNIILDDYNFQTDEIHILLVTFLMTILDDDMETNIILERNLFDIVDLTTNCKIMEWIKDEISVLQEVS